VIYKKREEYLCLDINYLSRDKLSDITKFINSDICYEGKVLILSGLRGTGNTTLMEQALLSYPAEKCAFYQVTDKATIDDVVAELYALKKQGINVVAFDEITEMKDFINQSALLPDVLAKSGMKIILAGTNSLGLLLAKEDELFNRTIQINTTHIPFAEHCRVLGTNNMDDYIAYGGLMQKSKATAEIHDIYSAKKYLDEAVALNISHSIKNDTNKGKRDTVLKGMPEKELQCIIEKMVELYSGKFNEELAKEELSTVTLHYANKELKNKHYEPDDIIEYLTINRREILSDIAQQINADTEITTPIDENVVAELEEYLMDMQVLSAVKTVQFIQPRFADEKAECQWERYVSQYEYHIIQPAIKYYHLEKQKDFIDESPIYRKVSEQGIQFMKDFLDNKIKGDMTEQIVLFDTANALSKDDYEVCKPVFLNPDKSKKGEYDMLIRDKHKERYWGFEIKHTSSPYWGLGYNEKTGKYDGQVKNFINPEITDCVNKNYGHRENVCVLYNGSPFVADGGEEKPKILYLNIADFMLAVDKYKDMDKVMEVLVNEKDLPLLKPDEKGNITFPNEIQACNEQVEIDL